MNPSFLIVNDSVLYFEFKLDKGSFVHERKTRNKELMANTKEEIL
jgi:hypothetical protein